MSGFVLSQRAASITITADISDTIFGITILSFATTLRGQLVAMTSGGGDHGGIAITDMAGSNNFLFTLYLGIAFVAVD